MPLAENPRYLRQRKLLGNQEHKLHGLTVAIVGVGGIGSFAALLGAQLGVKKLVLIDRDRVRGTDLGRQALYGEADIGKPKVEAAKKKLQEINPTVSAEAKFEQLDDKNAVRLLKGTDVVLDGTDNYETKRALNRYGIRKKKTVMFSSALKHEGWVFASVPLKTCFECWAPRPKQEASCEQVGVLNTTVALAASLQVQELVNWTLGNGRRGGNEMLRFELDPFRLEEIKVEKRSGCPACGVGNERK